MHGKATVVALSLVSLLFPASDLQAQSCVGTASFSSGAVRAGVAAEFTEGVNGYGVQLAFGSPRGPFVAAGLTAVDYDGIDERGTAVSVSGGYAVDIGITQQVQLCPLVGFSRQTGPDIDTGVGVVDLSARAFSFGGSVGGAVGGTPAMAFVPFVGAVFVMQKVSVDFGGSSESASDEFAVISAGAGFILNRTVTIRPSLSIPVGLEGSDPSYGISFAFNFGPVRQ